MRITILPRIWCLAAALMVARVAAMDPYYPAEQWKRYTDEVIAHRDHEKTTFVRPQPGASSIVAIQTLILPRFTVKNATVFEAVDEWQQLCEKLGVKVPVFIEPSIHRNQDSITLDVKNKTASECLTILCVNARSALQVELSGANLHVGFLEALNVRRAGWRTWVLSERAAGFCGLPTKAAQWVAVEGLLAKSGLPFPSGMFADFRPDLRALVVINSKITLDSIGKWIAEMEDRGVIEATKGKGAAQLEGYTLETRSFPVSNKTAEALHSWLFDSQGKLVPFAVSTQEFLMRSGLTQPAQSASWLDVHSNTLWLRNRPEQLAEFERQQAAWLQDIEKFPGIK